MRDGEVEELFKLKVFGALAQTGGTRGRESLECDTVAAQMSHVNCRGEQSLSYLPSLRGEKLLKEEHKAVGGSQDTIPDNSAVEVVLKTHLFSLCENPHPHTHVHTHKI